MNYMGSKRRLAKYIVPILQHIIDTHNLKYYVEPFCGGCNIVDKIKGIPRIATDYNKYLIELYRNIDKLSILDTNLSREEYNDIRESYKQKDKKYEDWYYGAIGFLASYKVKFFNCYGVKDSKNIRNYFEEHIRGLVKQAQDLEEVKFYAKDYVYISKLENCLIYCDPPYKDTTKYVTGEFDHDKFWDVIREVSKKNIVFVSEQTVPDDFKIVFEKDLKCTMDADKTKKTHSIVFEKFVTINNIEGLEDWIKDSKLIER